MSFRSCFFQISLLFTLITSFSSGACELCPLIKEAKQSIVGIGLQTPLASPSNTLQGTGFVVANGQYVITNYHVVSAPLDENIVQNRVVFSGRGQRPVVHQANIVDIDIAHDLALLKIEKQLPPVTLHSDEYKQDGTEVLITGFPIGAILGLYPASHRGIIAALSPDVIPVTNSTQIDIQTLSRLKSPFDIYQLDITAFPGNSGSPVYDTREGKVLAVVNKVFVSGTREAALSSPSGITYAIPVKHVLALLKKNNIRVVYDN